MLNTDTPENIAESIIHTSLLTQIIFSAYHAIGEHDADVRPNENGGPVIIWGSTDEPCGVSLRFQLTDGRTRTIDDYVRMVAQADRGIVSFLEAVYNAENPSDATTIDIDENGTKIVTSYGIWTLTIVDKRNAA